jgi:uncharacterized membrane protein YccC
MEAVLEREIGKSSKLFKKRQWATGARLFQTHLKIPKIDYNAWSYSLHTGCAACLALYISFSLNLDESHWAFTTCYIVGGQRLQGKILAKGLARVIGTLAGAIASFILVNAFAQYGVLFITCFAAWLSLCAITNLVLDVGDYADSGRIFNDRDA